MITIIIVIPLLALLAVKYVIKVVARLVKAIQVIVECSIHYIRTLHKDLVEALSVKD